MSWLESLRSPHKTRLTSSRVKTSSGIGCSEGYRIERWGWKSRGNLIDHIDIHRNITSRRHIWPVTSLLLNIEVDTKLDYNDFWEEWLANDLARKTSPPQTSFRTLVTRISDPRQLCSLEVRAVEPTLPNSILFKHEFLAHIAFTSIDDLEKTMNGYFLMYSFRARALPSRSKKARDDSYSIGFWKKMLLQHLILTQTWSFRVSISLMFLFLYFNPVLNLKIWLRMLLRTWQWSRGNGLGLHLSLLHFCISHRVSRLGLQLLCIYQACKFFCLVVKVTAVTFGQARKASSLEGEGWREFALLVIVDKSEIKAIFRPFHINMLTMNHQYNVEQLYRD